MTEVSMTVAHQRPVGAFLTALTHLPEADRPKTVEGLMQAFAGYLNAHFLDPDKRIDPKMPAPKLTPNVTGTKGEAAAVFVPATQGETGPAAIGTWMVHPYIEVGNIQRDAAIDLVQHRTDRVVMRLPAAGLLAGAEHDARILSVAGDTDKFVGPTYYYDYFRNSPGMTTMEYLWSRIADYTTSHCR